MKNRYTDRTVPPSLRLGDKIGIAAPAGPFDHDKFKRGIASLEKMGFAVFAPENLFRKNGYLAGSDDLRAEVLNDLFRDPSIKAIICARGGFGSIRILEQLDLEAVRQQPKVFVGFSDVTVLLSFFFAHCGLVTLHGPMVTTLAEADEEAETALFHALTSGKKLKIKPKSGLTIKQGVAEGPVLGGNLTTLCHLVGTPFQPDLRGCILLIEDVGEAPYRIDRMLIQMKLAGCLDGIAGLMLGSFQKCGRIESIYKIVERIFRDSEIPILAGFEIGHGKRNITIPIGLPATLDAGNHFLLFQEAATKAD